MDTFGEGLFGGKEKENFFHINKWLCPCDDTIFMYIYLTFRCTYLFVKK